MTRIQFNAASVEPDVGFEPVPPAWYRVMIDDSSEETTKDGQGSYLQFRYVILDGPMKGRKVFGRHNTKNASAKTMEIAYKQLSALCHATGVMVLEDTQQLHGIPLQIKVTYREAETDKSTGKHYDASNDIRGWKNINEPVDGPAAGPAQPAQPQQPVAAPSGWGQPQQPMQPQQPAQPAGWGQQQFAAQPQAAQQPAQQPWAQPTQVQQPAVQQQPQAQPWAGQQQVQQPQATPWAGQQPQAQPQGQPQQAQAPWQAQQPAQQPAAAQQPQQPAQAGGTQPPWAQASAGGAQPPWAQPR